MTDEAGGTVDDVDDEAGQTAELVALLVLAARLRRLVGDFMGLDVVRTMGDPSGVVARFVADARAVQRAVAEYVAERARLHCPVDSGRLRESIRAQEGPDGDWLVIVPVEYAAAVEFGAGARPADAFLRLALAEGRQKYAELADLVRFGRPAEPAGARSHGG